MYGSPASGSAGRVALADVKAVMVFGAVAEPYEQPAANGPEFFVVVFGIFRASVDRRITHGRLELVKACIFLVHLFSFACLRVLGDGSRANVVCARGLLQRRDLEPLEDSRGVARNGIPSRGLPLAGDVEPDHRVARRAVGADRQPR